MKQNRHNSAIADFSGLGFFPHKLLVSSKIFRSTAREWVWKGMGIDCMGMGGNRNVKSHSSTSLVQCSLSRSRLVLRSHAHAARSS